MSLSRSQFLTLSSFFLLIWFRFENIFHSHWLPNAILVLLSILLPIPFLKSTRDKSRYVIVGLWLLICCVPLTDFIQTSFLSSYSEARFRKKMDAITSVVQDRAKAQVTTLRQHIDEVREQLESIESLSPGSVFVQLQDHLGNTPYGWAVYDDQGSLLAWKGQFSAREVLILPESEELTIYNDLHQQFLRLKRVSVAKQITFIIVVNRPIAADYGIHNRYLRNYNLLTDDLAVRPDLLL